MKFFTPRTLLNAILMASALCFVSCGDDDEVDCNKLESQLFDISDDYEEAYDNGDCEDLEGLYDKLVDKYKEAKGCKEFKEALDDMDMTFNEFMEELEEEYEDDVADCGAPA